MRFTDSRDWMNEVAFGAIPKTSPWAKTGYNPDVGTVYEDMWSVGGVYVWPAAPAQLEVVSSSGNDTGAGSGVQQVQIHYLDGNYVEKSVIVTLNGVTPVPTGAGASDIFRIQSFRAYRCGGTVPNAAAGNIDVRTIGGGPIIYSRIMLGYTRARNDCWTVPAGKTLYVTSIVMSSGAPAAGKNVRFTTRANYDDANGRVLQPVDSFFMPFHEVLVQDGIFYRRLSTPTKLPATVNLRVSVISDANSALCESTLRGYLVTGTSP